MLKHQIDNNQIKIYEQGEVPTNHFAVDVCSSLLLTISYFPIFIVFAFGSDNII